MVCTPQPLRSLCISRASESLTGFTLIELSVVLVIIGLIMFAGIAAWSTIVEGQRITSTRATMENIKRCLITRVMYSEAFPTWQMTNMDCAAPRSQFDVDHCLCGRTDAWGSAIRYISGLKDTTSGLVLLR
jgi:prepilin-type N-terminal cleavage/methylation domain-containing protein